MDFQMKIVIAVISLVLFTAGVVLLIAWSQGLGIFKEKKVNQ